MAEDPASLHSWGAGGLELLCSGNFADVDIVCGRCTWKCHRAILASRSDWFRKAFSAPSEEASTKRVNLNKLDHESVDLVLKYIYGLGLDVESSVSDDHPVVDCVALYKAASFLNLKELQSSVKQATIRYCEKRWTQISTRPRSEVRWAEGDDTELSLWALDMVLGIRNAYGCHFSELQDILMEFLWIGRGETLCPDIVPAVLRLCNDTPDVVVDLISWYSLGNWLDDSQWAAKYYDPVPHTRIL